MNDLIVNKYNNSKFQKMKNIQENNSYDDGKILFNKQKYFSFFILSLGRITKIKSIEKNILQHDNENDTTSSSICQYKSLPTIMFDCQNRATYKCSHCSISFCLQHGL
jgi:hypothetical protein